MRIDEPFMTFTAEAEKWSGLPFDDSAFLPGMKELLDAMKAVEAESESLRRYRATRARMGRPEKYFMGAPEFPYSIQVS